MNDHKLENVLTSVVLTLSAALCFAGLAGWIVNDTWWSVRIGILAFGLAIAGCTALLLSYYRRQDGRLAERHFEALWKLDTKATYTSLDDARLPPLSPRNPWFELAERVHQTVMRLYNRIQDLERAKASLEIRCRRATAQAEQASRILNELSDPIFAINDFDEIVLANRSTEELFNLNANSPETRVLSQVVQCQKLVQLLTLTRQRKIASQRTDEIEIIDALGRSHWYRATAVKSTSQGNNCQEDDGIAVVLHDIGDQKGLQKRNAEFVASVSHEMKTPLAGIKAYVELLADGSAEDEQTREEFLGIITGQAERLQRLIDNMLNLARIEAGVVHVCKQARSLNELLEESLRIVQPSAEAKNIELTSELSSLYLGVLADRDMLLQAAINLLSNAIKYTPDGGKVTLRSRMVGDQASFEVQDTGVGLAAEDCDRVFEKFYRVKKDKEMASGTGLGLPLAKQIVEDVHGGRLSVASVLGRGSTFSVTMPCAGKDTAERRAERGIGDELPGMRDAVQESEVEVQGVECGV